MEHEYRHRYREAQMHEYQCCSVVQDSKCSTVDRDQRNHNYLERDYHGKQHYHEDDLIDLPCFSYKDISCHGGEQNDQEHTHTGNDQGVLQDVHEVHLLESIYKVICCKTFFTTPAQWHFDNITFVFEGIQHDHVEREHIDDKQHYSYQCFQERFDASYCLFLSFHYASTSFRLLMIV